MESVHFFLEKILAIFREIRRNYRNSKRRLWHPKAELPFKEFQMTVTFLCELFLNQQKKKEWLVREATKKRKMATKKEIFEQLKIKGLTIRADAMKTLVAQLSQSEDPHSDLETFISFIQVFSSLLFFVSSFFRLSSLLTKQTV